MDYVPKPDHVIAKERNGVCTEGEFSKGLTGVIKKDHIAYMILLRLREIRLHSEPMQLWYSKKCKLNRTNFIYLNGP